MRHDGEAHLRAAFDVRTESFTHGDWRVELLLPAKADDLIDEAAFAHDERLPYWAELWPSARALTRHVLDAPPDPGHTGAIELGCGVALPSLALRRLGADVLATDWYEDALRFAEANAERNGLAPLRTAALDWHHPVNVGRYHLVLAADVLYEQRNAGLLRDLLPRVTAPGGVVLLADPGRAYVGQFVTLMRQASWRVEERAVRMEPAANGTHSRVTIFELRAPA